MKIKKLLSVMISASMLLGVLPLKYIYAEENNALSADAGALDDCSYAFDFTDVDVYYSSSDNIDTSYSDDGVFSINIPSSADKSIQFNAHEQMLRNRISIPDVNYARLSFYMKLTADDLYKFANGVGTVYPMNLDKSCSNTAVINAQYLDLGIPQRVLYYNASYMGEDIMYLEPGSEYAGQLDEQDTKEWTHVEYWMDMSGEKISWYLRLGDQDIKGPVETNISTEDVAGFGYLDFGWVKDVCDGTLEIKDMWYSWGEYAEDIGKGAPDDEDNTGNSGDGTSGTSSDPLALSGGSHDFNLNGTDIYIDGDGSDLITGSYNADSGVYTAEIPSSASGNIQLLVHNDMEKDANLTLEKMKYARLSYYAKVTTDDLAKFSTFGATNYLKADKSIVWTDLLNPSFMNFGETNCYWYASKADESGNIGYWEPAANDANTQDMRAWTHFEYWADLTGDTVKLYIRVGDQNVRGPVDTGVATTDVQGFGRLKFTATDLASAATLELKNVCYSWGDEINFEQNPGGSGDSDGSGDSGDGTSGTGTDLHALSGGSYKFNFAGTDVYTDDESIIKAYDASTGVYTATFPAASSGALLFNGHDDISKTTTETPQMNYARLSFYVKLTSDDMYKFSRVGSVYAMNKDKTTTLWEELIKPQYMSFGDAENRYLFYNTSDEKGNIGYWQKNDANVWDFAQWTHVEYWADLTGETIKMYVRVGDGDVRGPIDTGYSVSDTQGFGRIKFQVSESISEEATLEIKDIWYSWGDEVDFEQNTGGSDDSNDFNGDPITADFELLANKGKLKVAYLGGSITEGAGCANDITKRWTTQITDWLNSFNMGTEFEEINAGIGGTPSTYGLMRLARDVISKNPDIVFVEFALNDEELGETESARAYEGILRKLMEMENKPYVICVGVVGNRTSRTRASLHKKIANHYGLQFIDLQEYMDEDLGEASRGVNTERDALFYDEVHPNENGYTYYTNYLKTQINQKSFNKPDCSTAYGAYYDCDGRFINAASLTKTGNWTAYGSGDWGEKHLGNNGSGLASSDPSSELTYTFTGKTAIIGHRFNNAAGTAIITIDGTPYEISFNGYISSQHHVSWFRKYDLEDTTHTISIKPKGDGEIRIDFLVISSENPAPEMPDDSEGGTLVANPDALALSGGAYAFDFTKSNTSVSHSKEYNSETGVLTVTMPQTGSGTAVFNMQDQLKDAGIETPHMKWARLSYYMKLTADDLYKFGSSVGAAYPMYTGKVCSNNALISSRYMDFDDGAGHRYLFFEKSDAKGNIGYWEPGTTNPEELNTREWTHVEYWMDLSGETIAWYVRLGDQDIRGPIATNISTKDIAGFGHLDFGYISGISNAMLEIKDVWYSWGNECGIESDLRVMSSTISEGEQNVEIINKAVSTEFTFNHKLKAEVDLADYISITGGQNEFAVERIDDYTLKVTIKELTTRTNYVVTVSNQLPFDSGEVNDWGIGVLPMKENFTLNFTTWPDEFEMQDLTIKDSSGQVVTNYTGQEVTVDVKLVNNRTANCTDGYVYAVVADSDGMMYSYDIVPIEDMAIGTEQEITVSIDALSEPKEYIIELYAVSGVENILPFCKKSIIE